MTGIAVIAASGLAAAQETDGEVPEETLFNFGYDAPNHLFVWGIADNNGDHDCTLENGALDVVYQTDGDGFVVSDLTEPDGDTTITFPAEDEADEDLEYSAGGDCGVQAVEVAGPNGQINHGQFMKLWNSLYEGRGRGCINRFLAQSDLGKDDQQIRVDDVDPDFEPFMDSADASGEVTFNTALADCERESGNGNAKPNAAFNRDQDGPRGNGNANPAAASNGNQNGDDGGDEIGRPESPGRSGDAPGRNKD